jgi:hypothetical protein
MIDRISPLAAPSKYLSLPGIEPVHVAAYPKQRRRPRVVSVAVAVAVAVEPSYADFFTAEQRQIAQA